MDKLRKYTLNYDKTKEKWALMQDKTHRVVKIFTTKENAIKGGVFRKALGSEGGSVKIGKKNKKGFEEERTYPASRDPHTSKG